LKYETASEVMELNIVKKRLAVLVLGIMALLIQDVAGSAQENKFTSDKPVKPANDNHPLAEIYSGYHYLSDEIKAMQDSDIANPGMAWYVLGKSEWSRKDGQEKKACDSCHNEAKASMRGVATRYPVYDKLQKKLVNVEQRINLCHTKFMKAGPLEPESDNLLGLSIYVRAQSRGLPVKPNIGGPARPFFEKGKAYYNTRRGQLDMSCSHCHDKKFGKKARSTLISQGQSNGYPVYSLEKERPISLHRRFIRCNQLVRAEPLPIGDEVYVNLELYLAWRGEGLPVETPAVRN